MEAEYISTRYSGLTAEQQKAVGFLAEFTKQMVGISFSRGKTPTRALNLIQEVYQVADDIVAGCFESGTKPLCKEGCFWCCFLRVKVTPLEVMSISEYLRSHLRPLQISALWQRLVETDEIIRGMDGSQRVSAKIACPLLVDGKCIAYPVRPLTCRAYHSLNSSDCEALLDNCNGGVTIRSDISVMSIGVFVGLTEGLRIVGLRTRLLELTAGLRIVMEEPGFRVENRWLSGEPEFVDAEITNAKKVEDLYRELVEEFGESLH